MAIRATGSTAQHQLGDYPAVAAAAASRGYFPDRSLGKGLAASASTA